MIKTLALITWIVIGIVLGRIFNYYVTNLDFTFGWLFSAIWFLFISPKEVK